MTEKLPRKLIEELDQMANRLVIAGAEERGKILTHLQKLEESGKVPLAALLAMTEGELNAVALYAVGALGRNGRPEAVNALMAMLQRNRGEDPMVLEAIVDALGETGDAAPAPILLELIGIRSVLGSLTETLRGILLRIPGVPRLLGQTPEVVAKQKQNQDYLLLPVIRALEKIKDTHASRQLEPYLTHEDPLVRWHTIQNLMLTGQSQFVAPLKVIAEKDESDLVREMAAIALENLTTAPK